MSVADSTADATVTDAAQTPALTFSDAMKAINYPRPISIEKFQAPTFELVADALFWMVKRYDPKIQVHESITTENDRVSFILSIVKAMHSSAGVQLDAKNLYAADGKAIGELAKVASILHRAMTMYEEEEEETSGESMDEFAVDVAADVEKIKALTRDISESGARLSQLLQQHEHYKETKTKALLFLDAALSGSLGHDGPEQNVEISLKHTLETTQGSLNAMKERVRDLTKHEKDLGIKLAKKKQDLDRSHEQLAELEQLRPAYMDEYEILEDELKELHQTYVTRVRNIHYLEHELSKMERREAEAAKRVENARLKLQQRLKAEEQELLLLNDSSTSEDDSVNTSRTASNRVGGGISITRPTTSSRSSARPPSSGRPIDSPDASGTSISSESDGSSIGSTDTDSDW